MEEKLIVVGIGIVGWISTILIAKVVRGSTNNVGVTRCSTIVKQEVKSIRRYMKSINDSVK